MSPEPVDFALAAVLDLATARIEGRPRIERRLSDLRGSFADAVAYEAALRAGDPLVYTVAAVESAHGEGQLHYGLGMIQPGKIGEEYFLTKGHYHAFRPAAEVYLGLAGDGLLLLEGEAGSLSRVVPLRPHSVVYVPGHTAHRTINVGGEPLVYVGVYPAEAGHDYGAIAGSNFRTMVIERGGQPVAIERREYRPLSP